MRALALGAAVVINVCAFALASGWISALHDAVRRGRLWQEAHRHAEANRLARQRATWGAR